MDADTTISRPRRIRWLSAALILVALGWAAYSLAPQTIGEQSRRSLLKVLREHYSGTIVSIGGGRFVQNVGLIFEDIDFVRAHPRSRSGYKVLHIDRLVVEADLRLERISEGELPFSAKRIVASGVELHAWQESDTKWSIEKLLPLPKMGPSCPRFEVHNARLRLYRDGRLNDQMRPLGFDEIQIAINVIPESPFAPVTHQFSLHASSEFTNSLRIDGSVNAQLIQLQGTAKGLRVDPVVTGRLPIIRDETRSSLAGLTATGDFTFKAQKAGKHPIDFDASWDCHHGRYEHSSLPQPIDHIRGLISMRPEGATIKAAQANLGDAICRIAGATQGWSPDADLSCRLLASNLMLTERFAASLPQGLQASFDKIRPRGKVDVDSRLKRTAGKWNADAVVDLQGVEVNVDKFPYPVSQLIGKVNFRDSQVWGENLSGRISSQRLSISFLRSEAGRGQPSWVSLDADGPIPIDSTLLQALTPRGEPQSKLEKFVRSLAPRGSVHLAKGLWNTSSTGHKSHFIDLRISQGNMRYSGFPYALYEVAGQVIAEDDKVSLLNFHSKNADNAIILCEGMFENLANNVPRSTQGDWRVGLHFQATDVPLDETIRAALPHGSQQTWDALAPAGVLDSLDVQLSHAATYLSPQLLISAKQHPRRTIDGRSVSLRPTMLPYRLDMMEGSVRYDGEQVVIESLDARHDATRLAADGYCKLVDNGQWRLDLNVRSGSRLHPDSELINSLPPQMRGAFQRLQLRGPLSIRGTTGMLLPNTQNPDPTIDWGLTIQLEGNRIGDVGPVHDLRGEIKVQGKRDGVAVNADGIVNIDSIHVNDKQITAVRGPFAIRDDRLLLGETIALAAKALPAGSPPQMISPIEGRMFGGVVSMSGEMLLSNANFDVQMRIRDGDVPTLLADLGESHSTTVGGFEGQVRLEGTVGIAHLLKGTGSAKLTNANLYQLPILVQVFNMLRIKPSEAVAFTDGEVRFAIYGEDVTFSQMQLWGDLIALHGTGTMSRNKEIDLSFNTRVSPQNGWSQLMRPFGENQYTLWTINVRGPLSDPTIERRTLNTVNETLERLFPGIADPVQPPGAISTQVSNLRDRVFK
jgi:hypothetical protein